MDDTKGLTSNGWAFVFCVGHESTRKDTKWFATDYSTDLFVPFVPFVAIKISHEWHQLHEW
jgi:hypothetical protein